MRRNGWMRTILMIAAVVLLAPHSVAATGLQEHAQEPLINMENVQLEQTVTVKGPLAVYGNEPHTYLALEMEDPSAESGTRLVQMEGELLDILYELQGERVVVTGVVTRLEIGPGFPMIVDVTEFALEEKE